MIDAGCYPCILKKGIDLISLAAYSSEFRHKVLKELIRSLSETSDKETPLKAEDQAYRMICSMTRQSDPCCNVRKDQNSEVMKQYQSFSNNIRASESKLERALCYSLAGNIYEKGMEAEKDIGKVLVPAGFAIKLSGEVKKIEKTLRLVKTVLIIGDAAGEIGLERFLIEEIKRINPAARIIIGVKRQPVYNYALKADARYFGMDIMAEVIDADDAVGLCIDRADPSFRKIFHIADFIIVKGQADYMAIEEGVRPNILYLFQVKCSNIAEKLLSKPGDFMLRYCEESPMGHE